MNDETPINPGFAPQSSEFDPKKVTSICDLEAFIMGAKGKPLPWKLFAENHLRQVIERLYNGRPTTEQVETFAMVLKVRGFQNCYELLRDRLAEIWLEQRVPNQCKSEESKPDALKVIAHFLDAYLDASSSDTRDEAGDGKIPRRKREAACDVLPHVLGDPNDPAGKGAVPGWGSPGWGDRWLTEVVLDRNDGPKILEELAKVLREMPDALIRQGIPLHDLLEAIDAKIPAAPSTRLGDFYHEFWQFVLQQKRLPTKSELCGRVGVSDPANATDYLRALGFNNLPHAEKHVSLDRSLLDDFRSNEI